MKAYGTDLATIHDVAFGTFAEGAAPGVLALLRQRGIPGGLVVDLGCGSGRWARRLADAGYDVMGVDLSAAMIDLARRRVPEGRFRTESFLDVDLPPCRAVTSLGECFSYLFDERNGRRRLDGLFRRVWRALSPGGLFVFDVATPGRGAGPEKRCWQGADWALLVEVSEDARARRLTRRITTFRRVGRLYRRDQEVHRLRLYEAPDLAAALRRAGFRARIVRGYGRERFGEGLVGFLARKP